MPNFISGFEFDPQKFGFKPKAEFSGNADGAFSDFYNLFFGNDSVEFDGKTFENVFTLNGTTQGISIGTLGDEVNAIKNTFDARKADVDSAKDNYKLNDYQKTAVDRTVSSIETTSKTYAATQANYYVDDTTVNQNTPIPPNPGGQNP